MVMVPAGLRPEEDSSGEAQHVNYRPALTPERAPHYKKPDAVWR
jgi:hypothetical protein